MKSKITLIAHIFALAIVFSIAGAFAAQAQVSNGADDGASASQTTTSSGANTSATISNGADDTSSTGSHSSNSITSTPATISNGADDGSQPQSSGGTSGSPVVSGGGSNGGGSFGGSSLNVIPGSVLGATCPLITANLKLGNVNDSAQVTALQSFLTNVEHITTPVNGTFDVATENSVKAFQAKYSADVLSPWSASEPSGFVYITTRRKLNQLACSLTLARTAEEQAIIDAYKNNKAGLDTTVGSASSPAVETTGSTGNSSNLGPVGINALDAAQSANVAAIGNLNIFQKFWNFLKSLF